MNSCFILTQFDTLSPLFRVKGESKLKLNSLFPFWGCSGQAHDVWEVNHAESPEHFKLEWIQWLVPSAEQRSQPAAQHGWEKLGLVENTVLPPLGHIRWPILYTYLYTLKCVRTIVRLKTSNLNQPSYQLKCKIIYWYSTFGYINPILLLFLGLDALMLL